MSATTINLSFPTFIDSAASYGKHAAYTLGRAVSTTKNVVTAAVDVAFAGLASLSEDTNGLASISRKMYKYTLLLCEYAAGAPQKFSKLTGVMRSFVDVVDFVQLAADIDYFVNRKFVKENALAVASRVAGFAAGIGGALLWLKDLGFVNLGKIAQTMGDVKLFGFVPKVVNAMPLIGSLPGVQKVAQSIGNAKVFSFVAKQSLSFVTFRCLDVMYSLLAIDAARRLFKATDTTEKVISAIDLTSCATELTLSGIVVLAGVTNVVALGVLGGVSIALTLSKFAYKATHEIA